MITIEDIKKEFGGLKKEELYQKLLEERTRNELSKTNFDKVVDQLRESNKQLTEELSGRADVRLEYDRLRDSIIGDLVSDMVSSALQDVDWDEMIGHAIQKHLQVDVSDTKDGIETEISWN